VNTYRLTLTFRAPRLTVRLLRWAIAAYSHPDAPQDVRLRVERID
jgi:hypothetical protein